MVAFAKVGKSLQTVEVDGLMAQRGVPSRGRFSKIEDNVAGNECRPKATGVEKQVSP